MDVAVGHYKIKMTWDCGCEMEMESVPDGTGDAQSLMEFLSECIAHVHSESLKGDAEGRERGHLCHANGKPRPPLKIEIELIPPTEQQKRLAAAPWN